MNSFLVVRHSRTISIKSVLIPIKSPGNHLIHLFQLFCFAVPALSSPQGGRQVDVTYIGDLTDTEHDVGGKVYILDQDTLVIDEFSYDGNGFGVYINVATKGRNLRAYAKNRIDVPYPSGSEVSFITQYDRAYRWAEW